MDQNQWKGLRLLAKVLATIAVSLPLVAGVLTIRDGLDYREPDPGPGNMPSFVPAKPFIIANGVVTLVAAVPLLFLAVVIWRARARALLVGGIIFTALGAVLAVGSLAARRQGTPAAPSALLATTFFVTGVLLIAASREPTIPFATRVEVADPRLDAQKMGSS
jgi:hypothetical protein